MRKSYEQYIKEGKSCFDWYVEEGRYLSENNSFGINGEQELKDLVAQGKIKDYKFGYLFGDLFDEPHYDLVTVTLADGTKAEGGYWNGAGDDEDYEDDEAEIA